MAVFFASVLPQFAPERQGMLSALVALGLVFSALTFVWLALYAVVVARAGAFLRGSRVRRAIELSSGWVSRWPWKSAECTASPNVSPWSS